MRSSGPAGDSHPTAMGLYNKLPGLPPVWEHFYFPDHKLFFDGETKNRSQVYISFSSGSRWIINSKTEYLFISPITTTTEIPQTGWKIRTESGWKEDISFTVTKLNETDDINTLNLYIGGLYS